MPETPFSVGTTMLSRPGIDERPTTPHLRHSNASLKYLKRFIQAISTHPERDLRNLPASATHRTSRCLQISRPSLPPISLPIPDPYRPFQTRPIGQSPSDTPHIRQPARPTKCPSPLRPPLSRQHRDKPSNNSRFISPTPLQRDKPSRNSRICLAETLPVKQNKSAAPIPSHTAVFTETNQVAAPDLSHHYRYLQIPRQHGDRRGKRLPRKRG
ncbi:hypothetical protein PG1528B_0118 [Bifidobacterium animalis subsp. lactis]|nr:hypothetical protein PG1528B_0118 [Bifidobacterium animalis subsp. lactis]